MEKEVTLGFSELEQLETLHRHSRDAVVKSITTSILSKANDVKNENIVYETICNHRDRRDPDQEIIDQYSGAAATPGSQCETCGTVWAKRGGVLKQNEINGGAYEPDADDE